MSEGPRQLTLDLPLLPTAGGRGGESPVRQLALDLPAATSFAADDFLVGTSNERAYGVLEIWPAWPEPFLLLVGPAGSGKSHLASMWAARAGAETLAAAEARAGMVPRLAAAGALVIEDLDRGPLDEPALFHLVNLARERKAHLLLTMTKGLDACGLATPDLVSRLRLAPSVELGPPDDALLKAVLVKLFLDRQLVVDTNVVEFLAARIERSLGAARRAVAELDREALSRGRRVTRPVAADMLSRCDGRGPD